MTDLGVEIDLDDPGYMRHCVYAECKAEFHVLRGPVDGWRVFTYGGPAGGCYICPDHAPVAIEHRPSWVRDEGPITGTRCLCGWRWMPEERTPAGVHLEAWKFHLIQLAAPAESPHIARTE